MNKTILHIFPDSLFTKGYMDLVSRDYENTHLFILTDIGANVEYDFSNDKRVITKLSTFKFADFIKLRKALAYAKADLIIIHSGYLNYLLLAFVCNNAILSKSVLSLWGGSDSRKFTAPKGKKEYMLFAIIYNVLRRSVYRGVKAITSVVSQDYDSVKEIYGINCPRYQAIYPFVPNIENSFRVKDNKVFKIQVCHSGSRDCRTLEALDIISKFKNESILVYASLSYGDENYITEVMNKGKQLFGEKFIEQRTILPAEEYARYISGLDVLLNNSLVQQGLGNIYLALASGVKIYLDENGILKHQLTSEGVISYNTESIIMTEFTRIKKFDPIIKAKNASNINVSKYFNNGEALKIWYDVFDMR